LRWISLEHESFSILRNYAREMFTLQSIVLLLGTGFGVLDGIFTILVIKSGGIELNPLIRFLFKRIGVRKAVFITRLGITSIIILFWMEQDTLLLVSALVLTIFAMGFTLTSAFPGAA